MGLILNLETATKVCAVALALDGETIASETFTSEKYSHAEKLNGLIIQVIEHAGKSLKELDAVAVSEGPGSYTGLRIGTSTAKGLCFALDIPLIAVNSLLSLAAQTNYTDGYICPMFDARRMEVYSAIYDSELGCKLPTAAVVIEADSYSTFLAEKKVYFVGPGADKCQEILTHENAVFNNGIEVTAEGMTRLADEKFQTNDFVDLAYFEPFYLKDFIAGKPKKIF